MKFALRRTQSPDPAKCHLCLVDLFRFSGSANKPTREFELPSQKNDKRTAQADHGESRRGETLNRRDRDELRQPAAPKSLQRRGVA